MIKIQRSTTNVGYNPRLLTMGSTVIIAITFFMTRFTTSVLGFFGGHGRQYQNFLLAFLRIQQKMRSCSVTPFHNAP